jgi:hypothetical protein
MRFGDGTTQGLAETASDLAHASQLRDQLG